MRKMSRCFTKNATVTAAFALMYPPSAPGEIDVDDFLDYIPIAPQQLIVVHLEMPHPSPNIEDDNEEPPLNVNDPMDVDYDGNADDVDPQVEFDLMEIGDEFFNEEYLDENIDDVVGGVMADDEDDENVEENENDEEIDDIDIELKFTMNRT